MALKSDNRILLAGPRLAGLRTDLEREGALVLWAETGVAAIDILADHPCDGVLFSLDLGDLTATELVLAARRTLSAAFLVLIEDPSRAPEIVGVLQAGADGFLPQNIPSERLWSEIARRLEPIESRRRLQRMVAALESRGDSAERSAVHLQVEVQAMAERLRQLEQQLAIQKRPPTSKKGPGGVGPSGTPVSSEGAHDLHDALTQDHGTPIISTIPREAGPRPSPALLQTPELYALQLQPLQLQGVQSAVEHLEPLRWGLASLILALSSWEHGDPGLAVHVRNLRLLENGLLKLAQASTRALQPGLDVRRAGPS